VSTPSHALFLAMRVANIEARHGGSMMVTTDHLLMAILKIADTDIDSYVRKISMIEQESTRTEIDELRTVLRGIDTTRLRRAIRTKIAQPAAAPQPETESLGLSRQADEMMAKLRQAPEGWGCVGLLGLLMESPGRASAAEMSDQGVDRQDVLTSVRSARSSTEKASLSAKVIDLHTAWNSLSNGQAPALSDIWRRIGVNCMLEFDGKGGVTLLQGGSKLVEIRGAQANERLEIFGASIASAIQEFEQGISSYPCRIPLAEF